MACRGLAIERVDRVRDERPRRGHGDRLIEHCLRVEIEIAAVTAGVVERHQLVTAFTESDQERQEHRANEQPG